MAIAVCSYSINNHIASYLPDTLVLYIGPRILTLSLVIML